MNYRHELKKFIDYVLKHELPYEKSWVYAKKLQKKLYLITVVPVNKPLVKTIIMMVEDEASDTEIIEWVKGKNVSLVSSIQKDIDNIREIFG